MHRLSRFLSELIPLSESESISGPVHVEGESLIAVDALEVSHKTSLFWSELVSSESRQR